MALTKPIELNCGVTASHWEVTGLVWTATAAQIILSGWIDKKARDSKKTPVEPQAVMTLSEADLKKLSKKLGDEFPTKQQLYDFVKSQKDWTDAKEV